MNNKIIICSLCRKTFKHKGALTMHKRITHEGIRYSNLWKPGHISKGNLIEKGQHLSTATEFRKGELSGEKHPKWKGGRVNSGGYVLVYKPNYHRLCHSNYVYEHIVIWEEYYRKELPNDYVVHHINGIKDDNRISNLLAVDKKHHSPSLTVKEVQDRLREVEKELKILKEGGDA